MYNFIIPLKIENTVKLKLCKYLLEQMDFLSLSEEICLGLTRQDVEHELHHEVATSQILVPSLPSVTQTSPSSEINEPNEANERSFVFICQIRKHGLLST